MTHPPSLTHSLSLTTQTRTAPEEARRRIERMIMSFASRPEKVAGRKFKVCFIGGSECQAGYKNKWLF